MGYLKQFKEKIKEGVYQEFLKLWEEYCFNENVNGEELIEILKEVKKSDFFEPFGKHVSRALSIWGEVKDPKIKAEILKLIVDIQNTNDVELADLVYDYLKKSYPEDKFFDEKIRIIGLRAKENFQGAISHFELLTHMNKGNFVFHGGGWGIGEILDVSLIREELTVDFETMNGKKSLSFETALKTLSPVSKDHFLAQRFSNVEELEKEAKENPLKVIYSLLKDLGPKTASEIKEELYDIIIPQNEWSKWWQIAKTKMKKDTKIENPASPKDPYILRKEDISHEDSFHKLLENPMDTQELISVTYSFLKDFPETIKNSDFNSFLISKIEAIPSENISNAQKLELQLLKEELNVENNAKEIIIESKPIEELVLAIDILGLKKRAFLIIKKERSDWQTIFLKLLFQVEQNVLRDYLFQELGQDFSELKAKIQQLITNPLLNSDAFIWYSKKILIDKEELFLSDRRGKSLIFESFLILMDALNRKDLETAKKMAAMLTNNKYKIIREIVQNATLDETKEFLLLASKCKVLDSHDIKIINSLAEVTHPILKQKNETFTDEDFFWATEESYKKMQEKLKHISTVEMVKNAKEIEEARALGDLRENAEYKAALERRASLQEEIKSLSNQFDRVRIITKSDVSTDKIGIGTKVLCTTNKKGEEVFFIFLGPWDASPEHNIFSLNSKFAQDVKDKIIGDKFTLKDKEYTIKEIKSCLEA